jgi:putative glycosyltransferase (TIGR04372 family)
MKSLQYYNKLLTIVIFYDYSYDDKIPSSLFSSDLSRTSLLIRFLKLIIAFPLALLAWAILRIIAVRYKVSIYVLKTFRPGWGSTYLNMLEPLCRQLQQEGMGRHIKILVDPGESVSNVLVKSYEPHFTMYLDDRRKFARLIAYLIPKSGLEKKYLNTSDKYILGWRCPPSINYINQRIDVLSDLANMDVSVGNFVLFTHASKNYYKDRVSKEVFSNIEHRFYDLSSYRLALVNLVRNNLKIIRVGTEVDELPESLKTLPIIEFTGENRTEEGELWLYENCKFLISATSGAYWFARRFDRPTLLTNSYALPFGYFSTLYTPMTFRSTETGHLLSFAEMLKIRHDPNFLQKQFMNDSQLELLPNSSLTIANAVDEMLNLGIEKFETTPEDLELMDRYKMILTSFNIPIVEKMTLPTFSFLREYSNLL